MVLHKQIGERHYVLHVLFNKKKFQEKILVENGFNILKKTFSELMMKLNLNVLLLPDVGCCILHNMILNGKDANIDE
jgi:hypothetical protein